MSDALPCPQLRTFGDLMAHLESGALSEEATRQIKSVVGSIQEAVEAGRGKASGSVTLTLSFKHDDGVIEIAGDLKAKRAALPRRRTLAWPNADGTLATRDPRQIDMPFRVVSGSTGEREAPAQSQTMKEV